MGRRLQKMEAQTKPLQRHRNRILRLAPMANSLHRSDEGAHTPLISDRVTLCTEFLRQIASQLALLRVQNGLSLMTLISLKN